MIKPSLISLRMFCLEFALAISLVSLGSNHIFFLPHLRTLAASRFWRRKLLSPIHRDVVVSHRDADHLLLESATCHLSHLRIQKLVERWNIYGAELLLNRCQWNAGRVFRSVRNGDDIRHGEVAQLGAGPLKIHQIAGNRGDLGHDIDVGFPNRLIIKILQVVLRIGDFHSHGNPHHCRWAQGGFRPTGFTRC